MVACPGADFFLRREALPFGHAVALLAGGPLQVRLRPPESHWAFIWTSTLDMERLGRLPVMATFALILLTYQDGANRWS